MSPTAPPIRLRFVAVLALSALLGAANALAQPRAVYQPDDRTVIRHLAPEAEADADGVLITAEAYERTALMCGGVVRVNAVTALPAQPAGPLDPAALADDPPDPSAVVYTFGPLAGPPNVLASSGGMTITYYVSGTLPDGALDALANVAFRYIALFDDDVDLHIDVKFTTLSDPNTIGSTTNKWKKFKYDEVRDAIVADADLDDDILLHLPSTDKLDVKYEGGTIKEEKHVYLTRAQAKSIGLIAGDATKSDGKFKFNTDFSFDYDPTNGINIGEMDFEHVVTHELGHLLGFASSVDFRSKNIEGLDLYRFSLNDCPTNLAEFTANPRMGGQDKQGVDASTCLPDTDWGTWRMSTGKIDGDGRQAGHWRDDGITGNRTGVMDPTLGDGAAFFNTTNNLEEYFSVADARAFDALGWDWLFSSVALDDFNLVSPPDGASIFALTPILDWSIATNATNYNVQLYFLAADYNSAEWVLLDEADTGVGTSYDVPSGLLERGRTYRWDVVAESPAGKRWSDVWYFTVAQLVPVPAPSPFLITNPPVSIDIAARNTAFTWELVDPELVSMYLVEIDTQATFQSPDLIKLAVFPPYPAPGEPLTELPPGLLRSGESYFCRVRAINGTGETFAGPVAAANFTVGSFPPEPFGLLYPGPGDRTPRDPRLQWQAAHDADNYDVEVASDSDFNDQVFSALEITGTDVKLPHGTLAPDTEYFWRARARNNAGTTRAEPLVQAFRTLPPRPGPFTLLDPPDDVILVSAAPILSFTGVTDPGGYFVVVDDDPDEGLSEVFAHTTDEFLALDPLPRGRLYHWSVTAYNAGGTRSGTPESSRFFIAAGDFDFNQDGARDLRDVAAYQRCYSQQSPALPPACGAFDVQPDSVLTPIDTTVLLRNLTGPAQ